MMASISIRNLIKETSVIQEMMALSKISSASLQSLSFLKLRGHIQEQAQASVSRIDDILLRKGKSPADLAVRSRRAYQWLRFLTIDQNLDDHLDGLQRINLFLPGVKVLPRYKRSVVKFSFYHLGSLYKVQGKPALIEITSQESFSAAPDTVLIALLETALGKPSQTTQQIIREYTFQPDYRSTRETLEYLGIPKGSFSKGSVHDLIESFKRVNKIYFKDSIPMPHLVWNNRLTYRKFGHYQWDIDTVMVSSTLDHDQVPDFVVDYVMYHELLHKKLGARQVNSRRMVHTGQFRKQEKEFIRFEEAQRFINKISRKNLT